MAHSLPPNSLRIIAHELRSPLTTLRLALQLGLGRLQKGEAVEPHALQRALAQVDEITAMIGELSEAANLASDEWRPELQTIDLAELLKQVAEKFAHNGTSHQVLLDLGVAEASVQGDRRSLELVAVNLLENAFRFSKPHSRVQVSISSHDGAVAFTVADNGIGIPSAEHERVFEMFFRASNASSASTRGFGLGLFVIHAIVVSHGGRIWFESELGRGSTFHVALPC
jgi:signal transduction histidine kinase